MPVQFTLPPDNRAVGTGNPPGDVNGLVDTVTAMGAASNVLNAANAGGADPTGVADSAAAWQAGLNALPSSGGALIVPPGTYKLSTTVTSTLIPTYILCPAGKWATTVNFTGTGDCIRMYNTVNGGGNLYGGGIKGLTIDGTGAGAGSAGLHIGDMDTFELDCAVQNFSGAGSIGVHFDNTIWFTEETRGYLWLHNNTQHLVFDVSGATTSQNSFDYTDLDVEILAVGNQDGVVFQNGALMVHGRLTVKANFQSSVSVMTNAVLRITGTVPAGHTQAGQFSAITGSRLDVQAEAPANTHTPQTIAFGTPGSNVIRGCLGVLDFAGGTGTFTPTNWSATANSGGIFYSGMIRGDVNLSGNGNNYAPVTIGAQGYGAAFLSGANGNMHGNEGDFFSATLSANITMSLASGSALNGMPQRKLVVLKQAAAGGPFTVTWPHAGSPTVSAPTVLWAGGTAPTMTATANAVDVYKLDTVDGATWYGTAAQNVS
jgi:hypothetical protein